MATDRQIKANRANSAKSTGATTEIGKAKSSQNAIRHGLLARSVVLNGESRDRFNSLVASLQDEFQPQTDAEFAFVEEMAVARWRQRRVWAIERAAFDHEVRKQELSPDSQNTLRQDAPTRAAIAFRTLSDNGRSLDLVSRYETRFARQFTRALNQLFQLRKNANSNKRSQFDS